MAITLHDFVKKISSAINKDPWSWPEFLLHHQTFPTTHMKKGENTKKKKSLPPYSSIRLYPRLSNSPPSTVAELEEFIFLPGQKAALPATQTINDTLKLIDNFQSSTRITGRRGINGGEGAERVKCRRTIL